MIDNKSPFFWEKDIDVRYSEMDYQKVLKPSSLLNFLQDIATFAAEVGGFGYEECFVKRKLAWFLLKYHMEFDKYPENIEHLHIKTEARGVNRLFASRDFEIYNRENNELLGRVISQWALVNFTDKSMTSPQEVFPCFNKVEKREDDLNFEKIHPLERVDYREEFKIRYEDIDVNQHVNNMNYILWAFEPLSKEFKDHNKIKTLDMVFKKEIQYGNSVVSEVQLDGDFATMVVKNKTTSEDLCLIKVKFESM